MKSKQVLNYLSFFKCISQGNSYYCTCPPGYTGPTCNVNPCNPNPCQNNGQVCLYFLILKIIAKL